MRLLIVMLLLPSLAWAQLAEVKTEQEMMEQAQKRDVPYFIELRTSWCGACKLFDQTLLNEEVKTALSRKFVAAEMDAESGDGLRLGKKYKARAFPTLLFFYKDGTLLGKMVGHQEPEYFLYNLEVFMKKYQRKKSK